ncbi:MAG: sulfotransferase family protein [Rhodospirillaceae bacterium]|nr:sulfotransferase family protein [Rhodospirillaceae bacterium]
MVISYMRRFLFVHVYKAAGMSVEKALKPFDVRSGLAGYAPGDQRRMLEGLGFNPAILDMQRHTFGAEIRDALGPELFGKLFKFAFVRNPWDLQLSLYHFNLKHPEFAGDGGALRAKDFEDFILNRKKAEHHALGQQKRFVVDRDGAPLMDFVGRFETLAADFATVCARINVRGAALEHINRTEHKPWQQSYTRRMFDIVREIHATDIAYFGYSDDPATYGIN